MSNIRGADEIPEDEEVALPEPLAKLSTCIEEGPETLATGNKDMELAALQAAKYVFDLALQSESKSRAIIAELLGSMVPAMAPQTRSRTASTRAGQAQLVQVKPPELIETPLPELVVDNMDNEQIWAQLELRAQGVGNVLEFALESTGPVPEKDDDDSEGSAMKRQMQLDDDDGEDDSEEDVDFKGVDDEDDDEDSESEGESSDDDAEDGDEEEDEEEGYILSEDDGDMGDLGEEVTGLHDSDEDEEDEDAMDLDASGPKRPARRRTKSQAHAELNDGFFDLDKFNADTEAAEAQSASRGHLGEDEDDEDEAMEADIDLFTAVDDGEEEDTKELFYNDFFAPPSRRTLKALGKQKLSKPRSPKKSGVRFSEEVHVKNIKAKGKNLPIASFMDDEDDEEETAPGQNTDLDENDDDSDDEIVAVELPSSSDDSEEQESDEDVTGTEDQDDDGSEEGLGTRDTIERMKDDLFADEEEDNENSGATTHEKRMAALREEIASLEAENVADKHWTMMGEATSRSRPQNALLEEDLEFDRVMKSVPVITEDVVQSLEEIIKARIADDRFDDVVRKRPVDDKPFLPSRLFELQDTKSKQSLAEIYEGEYVAAKTGGIAGEDRDGKLQKEHEEIEKVWEGLCAKMDALSNAHFTPKAPKASISTMSNIATASLESALPTTKATTTMLAPEEVFSASSADLRAKSEMTPAEKRSLRNKQKKAKRKAQDALEKSVDQFARLKGQSVKKQKEAALKSVVKNGKGVTVIGKKSKESAREGAKKAKA